MRTTTRFSSLFLLWLMLWVILPSSMMVVLVMVQATTLRDLVVNNQEISLFRRACSNLGILEMELDDPNDYFTIFAPTDTAMRADPFMSLYLQGMDDSPRPRWSEHLRRAIRNHMVQNFALTVDQIFDIGNQPTLFSMEDPLRLDHIHQTINGAKIVTENQMALNGVLHVMNMVLVPEFFRHSLANLELQPEFGPDWLDRVSMQTIADFIDPKRPEFRHLVPEGQTQVGCRIRALNRIGLFYLPKTLNRSPEIKFGEFLNASYRDETNLNLIQYSMVHKNVYLAHVPTPYEEWVMSWTGCSHMLISRALDGTLCFNDGCVVSTPNPRHFFANNGVGYVVDRCVVCSGVAMLLEYAALFTRTWNLKDASQFWESSEWNLRNLSMSTGNGGPITLIAAQDNAFNIFNAEDVSRISTDKWKRHQWNFLLHNMFQGALAEQDFINRWMENQGKRYNITALSGENVTFDYNEQRGKVLVQGGGSQKGRRDGPWGEFLFTNLKGVDGYIHFIETLPVPKSVTHSVYDLADEWENYTTQVTLIDTVFLKQDLRRLLPITGLFAPNEDWDNKVIDLEDIAKSVLENMIFKELQWCETLRSIAGQRLESHNGQTWKISINEENNMPCFDTEQVFGGPVRRSCVVECDLLARNGIVHKVDHVLLFAVPETVGPQPPSIPTFRNPAMPNFYTPPSPPTPGWFLERPIFYGPVNPAYVIGDVDEDKSGATTIMTMTIRTVSFYLVATLLLWFLGA